MHCKSETVLLFSFLSFLFFSIAFYCFLKKRVATGHNESCLALENRNDKYMETIDDDSQMNHAEDGTHVDSQDLSKTRESRVLRDVTNVDGQSKRKGRIARSFVAGESNKNRRLTKQPPRDLPKQAPKKTTGGLRSAIPGISHQHHASPSLVTDLTMRETKMMRARPPLI